MKNSRHILAALVLISLALHGQTAPTSRRSRATIFSQETSNDDSKLTTTKNEETTDAPTKSRRQNKALNFYGYFPSFLSSGLDYAEEDEDDVTFGVSDDDDDDLSRTIPSRRRTQNKKKNGNGHFSNDNINSLQYDNSPIFYIRLPPTPYMFVPGLGYVSQPPSLGPPMAPPQVDPFINLPLDFVSNGKPTGVYQWAGAPGYPGVSQMPQVDPYGYPAPQPVMPVQRPYNPPSYSKPKPKPTSSKVTNLKGQYAFNGKPGDNVYVLRDTYNSIYSDALQNFYP